MTAQLPRRVLMVRMDRIGDLILSLPVDGAFAHVEWWIPRGLSFITDAALPKREAREVTRDFEFAKFRALITQLRTAKFDAAILFHAPWWVSFAVWCAGIRLRAGVKSQWHSFLFLNRAVRQKRSRAEHSELEYNFRLVEEALAIKLPRAHLKLHSPFTPPADLTAKTYIVVHPGMSGSARNWPTERYLELIRSLTARGETVVITGTAADEPYLAPLREPLKSTVTWLDGKLSGPQLIALLANAKEVYAPSTGVLHIAASTGSQTKGIYSPVLVQQPKRWGPQGERTQTFMPDVDCPGEFKCLGPACPHFDCMFKITADQVLAGRGGGEGEGESGAPSK